MLYMSVDETGCMTMKSPRFPRMKSISQTGMTAGEILDKFKQGNVLIKPEYPTLSEVFKEDE